MTRIIIYIITSVVVLSAFFSCDNDDKFTNDSSIRLSFSSDTVRFDTVFTTVGTATKRLKIYNKNKNAVTISAMELVNADKTGFRMNVDGESGDKIFNVDILAKDSTYVFIEANIDPLNQNNPLLIRDSIRIQFNGVTQYVILEAIGQDVVILDNKIVDQNTAFSANKPYLIYNTLTVNKGVTLTIDKNAMLYFHKDAKVDLKGTIMAKGTIAEPIVFRGDRTDNMLESPVLLYDRVPGQWQGIFVDSDSYGNVFENVRVRNGIYGMVFKSSDPQKEKASLTNVIIQNTTKEGLWAINSNILVKNSLFANSSIYAVRLLGGKYQFIHCTVANYMYGAFITLRKPAVLIGNTGLDFEDKQQTYPLQECLFANSIVSGGLIDGNISLSEDTNSMFNHKFVNCLLKTKGTDDANFINIVWGVDPVFKFIYSSETASSDTKNAYYYNYELTKESPAIDKGSTLYSVGLGTDIRGVLRSYSNAPDIGCYEYVE